MKEYRMPDPPPNSGGPKPARPATTTTEKPKKPGK